MGNIELIAKLHPGLFYWVGVPLAAIFYMGLVVFGIDYLESRRLAKKDEYLNK